MRVLLVKLKHLGDTLLLTPTLRFLKEHHPDAQIDVVVRASCEPALLGNPDVSRVLSVARPESERRTWHGSLLENARLLRSLLTTSYDYAFDLSDSDRAKVWVGLSRAKVRGFRRIDVKPSWKHRVFNRFDDAPMTSAHQVMRDFETVTRVMGLEGPAGPLRFHPPADASALVSRFPWLDSSQPMAVIHATSRWSFKEWLPDRWAAVADGLAAQGFRVVFTGGPDARERETVARILANAAAAHVSLAGELTIPELGIVLARSLLFLGIDTFAMHLAAAVQTPMVAVFGPSWVDAWTPWQARAEVLAGPCRCDPSTHRECARPFAPCLEAITAGQVLDAAWKVLGEPSTR